MNKPATTFASENKPMFPVEQIPFDLIEVKQQIRKDFEPESLKQLGDSILQHGLVEPIVVKPNAQGGFELIAGERRLRAARAAGLKNLPTIVRADLQGQDTTILQAIENLQREDLTLAEECAAVSIMVEGVGFDQTCKQLSKSAAWVSKRSGVSKFTQEIKDLVSKGHVKDLEIAHALNSLQVIKPKDAEAFINRIESSAEYDGEDDERDNYETAPARSDILRSLSWAKEQQERKEREKLQRAAAKKDPKAVKAVDTARKEAEKKKAREQKIEDLKKQAEALTDQATQAIYVALGAKPPKRGHHGYDYRNPVRVAEQSLYSHMSRVPASREEVEFSISFELPLEHAEKLATWTGMNQIHLDDLDVTVEEARKIHAILGKRAVFKSLQRDKVLKGSQLQSLIAKIGKTANDKTAAKPAVGAAKVEQQGQLCVSEFIAQRLDRTDKAAKVKAADVHAAYVSWCKKAKLDPIAFNDNAWGEAIAAAGIDKKRSNGIQYVGCKLKAAK